MAVNAVAPTVPAAKARAHWTVCASLMQPTAARRLPHDDAGAEVAVVGVVVVVDAAGADGDEVAGLPALSRREQSYLIDLGAVRVIGMRIRRDVVPLRVVVDEQHPRARGDDQLA